MKRKSRQILSGLMALGIAAAAPMAAQALTFAPVRPNTVDTNLDSVSGQDVSSAPAAPATVSTETVPVTGGITVNVIPTGIRADRVFNTKGYANLVQDAVMSNPYLDSSSSDNEIVESRQVALMDGGGNLLFPFRKSYNNFYCYTDGIISLTAYSPYEGAAEPLWWKDGMDVAETSHYYDLAGNELFQTAGWGSPISEGFAVLIEAPADEEGPMLDEGSVYLINSQGQKVKELTEKYSEYRQGFGRMREVGLFESGLARVTEWPFWDEHLSSTPQVIGYMDYTGEIVLDLSQLGCEAGGDFSGPLTWVLGGGSFIQGKQLGFIDRAGNLVIPYQYESAWPFTNDGMAAVKKDGKWGYIDASNNTVIPFMYDDAFGIHNGLAAVGLDGRYGYVDSNNQVIVPLEYDDISTFENGIGYAIKDGCVYIITKQ